MRVRGIGVLLAAVGCGSASQFPCQTDDECGPVGVCAEPGFCAFEDSDCESGLRFGEFAGDGLEGQCVEPSGTGETGAPMTDGSSTSTTEPHRSSTSTRGSSTTAIPADVDGSSSSGGDPCPPGWWSCDWKYRRLVEIQWKGGAVQDFPAQVILDDGWISFEEASPTGDDVRFVMGTEVLAHELVTWDLSALTEAWVKIPDLASPEPLYLYYGNPSAPDVADAASVWSHGYLAVLHLIDETDTLGLLNLAPSPAERVPGLIGEGLQFTGNMTFMQDQGPAPLLFDEATTVSFVFNASGWGQASFGRILDASDINTTATGYSIAVSESGGGTVAGLRFGRGYEMSRGTWFTPDNSVALDQWHVAAFAYADGDPPSAWIAGESQALTEESTPAGVPIPPPVPLTIGALGSTDLRYFDGVIDEIHIAQAERDDAWMAAEHASFTDQLLSFGPEEDRDLAP